MNHTEIANELCNIAHLFGERRWCLATSGNFSARTASDEFLITQSGKEKSHLSIDDLMLCASSGEPIETDKTPSAETQLHALIYRLDGSVAAVLHTHSMASTVLSRAASAALDVCGYEMQKAFDGVTTHDTTLSIPVFDNDQDMAALATLIEEAWHQERFKVSAFLIRGHGLYAWGADIAAARRHVEGCEFLFECLMHESAAKRQ